jgi:hypothetical protein
LVTIQLVGNTNRVAFTSSQYFQLDSSKPQACGLNHYGLPILAEDGSQCAGDFAYDAVTFYGPRERL